MSEKSLEELEFEETGVTRKERWKIMWASIIGYAMDGLDVLILSFAMAAIVSEFGLTLGEGGLIATYTLIGTVLGGYLFGIFADYFGRVHTFSLTIIIFSIFTGACAFADNVTHLNILRFLAGLGLGGEYGIGMTLVSETWPAAKRARATAGVAMGAVIRIGIVEVERQMVPAVGVEMMLAKSIKPLGRLPVAFTGFGAQAA